MGKIIKKIGFGFDDEMLQRFSRLKKPDENMQGTFRRILMGCTESCTENIDSEILKKLIPVFIQNKLKVQLEPKEAERLRQIIMVMKK